MRIFLDSNVLFSAAKSRGAVRELLEGLLDAGHECCVDGFVVEEARRNLSVKVPGGIAGLNALLARLHVAELRPTGIELPPRLDLAEKDRPVLLGAIRHRCEALVTGDRTHFGALYGKSVHGVAIHSPRSLAELLIR